MPSKDETFAVQRRLGRAIRTVRDELKITQEELSRRTGLHPTYVSDLERGARNPSFAVVTRLAEGLEINLGELGRVYDKTTTPPPRTKDVGS